jgi:hypothetical protein
MAKPSTSPNVVKHESLVKRTNQGGRVKTSTLSKHDKRSFKRYRGQGR